MGSVPRQNTNSLAGRPAGSDRALAPRRAFGFARRGRTPRTALLAALGLTLGGCAAGIDPEGAVVVGWRVGEEATVIRQGAGAVAEIAEQVAPWLPAPWGQILTVAGGLGTAVAGGAWARSQGRHKGWSEREEAAAPKPAAPLPAPIPPPAGQWQTTVSREPGGAA